METTTPTAIRLSPLLREWMSEVATVTTILIIVVIVYAGGLRLLLPLLVPCPI